LPQAVEPLAELHRDHVCLAAVELEGALVLLRVLDLVGDQVVGRARGHVIPTAVMSPTIRIETAVI